MPTCPVPLLVPDLAIVLTAAPGTGSTSLSSFFSGRPGTRPLPAADVVADGIVVVDAKHATIAQLRSAGLVRDLGDVRIVTSTRNPFDFWAAEWHRTRTRWLAELRDPTSWVHRQAGMLGRIADAVEQDFDPWLRAAIGSHADAGRTIHLNQGHVDEADVVIRIEHVDADVASLLGLVHEGVPKINVTPSRPPYWQLYGVGSRHAVERVHAPDLDRFGYRF